MLFGHELPFWLAVAGATLLKLFTSRYDSLVRAVASVFSAVFCAYFFTDAVVDWFSLDPDTYKAPMAAIVALTGESVIRMVMGWFDSPQKFFDFLKAWRGK